jgi:predicted phosphodiesterase
MRMAIVGDVHGAFDVLEALLAQARDAHGIEAAVQVGDFGFAEDRLPARPTFRLPVPLYAVCGNHDDQAYLARARRTGAAERWAEANLVYQARASVVTIGPVCVGFIGGALHMDRPQRRHGGNVITPDEAARAAELFGEARPEVIVSHSCPAGIGIGMQSSPEMAWGVAEHVLMAGFDPGPHDDCGEAQLTGLWRSLRARPRLWCFGHFHVSREAVVGGTRFVCAPRIAPGRPLLVWDSNAPEAAILV